MWDYRNNELDHGKTKILTLQERLSWYIESMHRLGLADESELLQALRYYHNVGIKKDRHYYELRDLFKERQVIQFLNSGVMPYDSDVDSMDSITEDAINGLDKEAEHLFQMGCQYQYSDRVFEDMDRAIACYQQAAELGLPEAQFEMAQRYELADGVEKNLLRACELYHKAAVQDHADAAYALAELYANGPGTVKQDHKRAYDWYEQAAKLDHPSGLCALGKCYEYGQGVKKDLKKAIESYARAADLKQADAEYRLGLCYKRGKGVSLDNKRAAECFSEAARQGHAAGQNNFGICFKHGVGVEQDKEQAVRWFEASAHQNHADAQYNLGICFKNGEGVNKDWAEAMKWLRKAATGGHVSAHYHLGLCYKLGDGPHIEKNGREAVKWFRIAAEKNHAPSQNNYGICFKRGIGVEKNLQQATEWFRRSGNRGHADAQYNLGRCYAQGEGVKKNLQAAVVWLCKAAEQGHKFSQSLLKKLMDELKGIDSAIYDNQLAKQFYSYAAGPILSKPDEKRKSTSTAKISDIQYFVLTDKGELWIKSGAQGSSLPTRLLKLDNVANLAQIKYKKRSRRSVKFDHETRTARHIDKFYKDHGLVCKCIAFTAYYAFLLAENGQIFWSDRRVDFIDVIYTPLSGSVNDSDVAGIFVFDQKLYSISGNLKQLSSQVIEQIDYRKRIDPINLQPPIQELVSEEEYNDLVFEPPSFCNTVINSDEDQAHRESAPAAGIQEVEPSVRHVTVNAGLFSEQPRRRCPMDEKNGVSFVR